ncbi:outer membrane protein assembly factor BamB family protein [Halopiger aswanensis]|uniref:Beta-barrel assembly machine subunit BamB n=1 Tax=Halopiger aswanensis TaxID=148449 RepID=A0A419WEG6_9EURY|nr:PQQ-binding-like beta-propeller repeat protein [Halopiger aswanensis]RKD93869.1 Beta-barrel assembly machine subunit BamB [Halopiger aswanensis]
MTEWNQFKGDPQNGGLRRDLEGPVRLEEAWSVDLAAPVGPPVLDHETVYAGTERGALTAVDRETGRQRWTVETQVATDEAPVATRDRVAFTSADGTVRAVDRATGDPVWRTELQGTEPTAIALSGGGDRLYVGHAAGVTALVAETGEPAWTHETKTRVVGCPAIADDRAWAGPRVYVATAGEAVICLEAESGEEAWTTPADGPAVAGPTVADDLVYVADESGTLLAMDADSGQPWFSYEIDDPFASSPTVLPDAETTFVGAADGYLHVTDTTFGRRKLRGWLFSKQGVPLDGPVRASPVVIGDVVCVADETGSVYGLDVADDCSHLWHRTLEGGVSHAPAVGRERLYVGDDDGTLTCLTWTPGEPRP